MTADHDLLNEGLSEVRGLLNLARHEHADIKASLDQLNSYFPEGVDPTAYGKAVITRRAREEARAARRAAGLQAVLDLVRDELGSGYEWNIRTQAPDGGWVEEGRWQDQSEAVEWWRQYEGVPRPCQLVRRRHITAERRAFEVMESRP